MEEKELDELNRKCQKCIAEMAEFGGVNTWYCENQCPTGRAIHELERGKPWDMLDKTLSKYRRTIDGD